MLCQGLSPPTSRQGTETQSCHSLTCPTHHSIPPAPLHRSHQRWLCIQLLAFIPCKPLPIYASLDTYIDIDLHMQVPISIYIYLFYTYIFIYAFNEVLCFQLLLSSSGIRSCTRISVRGTSAGRSRLQAAQGRASGALGYPGSSAWAGIPGLLLLPALQWGTCYCGFFRMRPCLKS